MDLLAHYASDSEPEDGTLNTTTIETTLPYSSNTVPPEKNTVRPEKQKLRHKRIVAKFSCPIDYGDAIVVDQKGLDSDEEGSNQRQRKKKRLSAQNQDLHSTSIVKLLPPPQKALKPGNINQSKLTAADSDEDDDGYIPGLEDRTGMTLGQRWGGGDEEEDQELEAVVSSQHELSGMGGVPPHNGGGVDHLHTEWFQRMDEGERDEHGIKFKEISGASLRYMDPSARAEADGIRAALGPDYEGKLRVDAAKVGGVSKMARRRHQLSSLYVQAKEQELEQLEKRATGMKTKAETQRKYGW